MEMKVRREGGLILQAVDEADESVTEAEAG